MMKKSEISNIRCGSGSFWLMQTDTESILEIFMECSVNLPKQGTKFFFNTHCEIVWLWNAGFELVIFR